MPLNRSLAVLRLARACHTSCSIFLFRDEIPGDPQRSPIMIRPAADTNTQNPPYTCVNLGRTARQKMALKPTL